MWLLASGTHSFSGKTGQQAIMTSISLWREQARPYSPQHPGYQPSRALPCTLCLQVFAPWVWNAFCLAHFYLVTIHQSLTPSHLLSKALPNASAPKESPFPTLFLNIYYKHSTDSLEVLHICLCLETDVIKGRNLVSSIASSTSITNSWHLIRMVLNLMLHSLENLGERMFEFQVSEESKCDR